MDLRDPSLGKGKKGEPVVDEGVADKRRVYLQPELSTVLKQGHRESDPLLEYLRSFFDGEECVGSKTVDPRKVTGAHVSLFGHCTPDDLKMYLSDSDKANGTANRILWLFGMRSKKLPRGGDVFGMMDFLGPELARVAAALEFAKSIKVIRRDPSIEDWWEKEVYEKLDDIPPGKIGALFVRAITIVMRIASGFALADLTEAVEGGVLLLRRCHIEAALAIWEHSERSLRFIFEADVDPNAEKLLKALKAVPEGLTKRKILHEVFGRNKEAETVNALLKKLLAYRYIELTEPISTGGRPAPHYRLPRV
jgi:hypothetical protein